MGIPDFLKHVLENSGRPFDLKSVENLRIAIDLSTWMYRACAAFAYMLADERHISNYGRYLLHQEQQQQVDSTTNNNTSSLDANDAEQRRAVFVTKCRQYVLDRLQNFIDSTNHDILVVLDGATPPLKRSTVRERRKDRQQHVDIRDDPSVNLTGDPELLERRFRANKRSGPGDSYSLVIDIIIEALRSAQIPFLVAPYEADAQLAGLARHVDLIITDDSDLIAYGGNTPILYRLSADSTTHTNADSSSFTEGILIRPRDLASKNLAYTLQMHNPANTNFLDFSPAMWACLFALCGCDYVAKLKGIGIMTAVEIIRHAFLDPTGRPPLQVILSSLFAKTQDRARLQEENFIETFTHNFLSAIFMYRHAVIYDPLLRKCRYLHPLHALDPELASYAPYAELGSLEGKDLDSILGEMLPDTIAIAVAEGWVCPKSWKIRDRLSKGGNDAPCPAWIEQELSTFLNDRPKNPTPPPNLACQAVSVNDARMEYEKERSRQHSENDPPEEHRSKRLRAQVQEDLIDLAHRDSSDDEEEELNTQFETQEFR